MKESSGTLFFSQVREIDNTLHAHILLGYMKQFPSTLWVDILLNLFMIEVVIIFQFCFSVKEEAKWKVMIRLGSKAKLSSHVI